MVRRMAVVVSVLLAALSASAAVAVVEGNGQVLAEVGVHHIQALKDSERGALSSLVRRDISSAGQTPAATTSLAYPVAVLEDHPVAYWSMSDLVGNKAVAHDGDTGTTWRLTACGGNAAGTDFGDACEVDADIASAVAMGSAGLIPTNTADKAMTFDGTAASQVLIPENEFINLRTLGYTARTVELWFKAGDLTAGGSNSRTVYEEGSAAHTGVNIYVKDGGAGATDSLYMYAWDRGNSDVEFGTALINPTPLTCTFPKGSANYVAFVYSAADNKYSGYIGSAGDAVKLCGEVTLLPNGSKLRHHGHSVGNAVIGGVQVDTRTDAATKVEAVANNFVGTIDEVAIYNTALTLAQLKLHRAAALGGAVAATNTTVPR